jgi:hypothetical protein
LDEKQATRAIAVVDYAEGQSIEALMAQSFLRDTVHWERPVVVATLPLSMIVIATRRNAPSP